MDDFLEEQEFYELMQNYRHAPISPQKGVVDAYEAVKEFIRNGEKMNVKDEDIIVPRDAVKGLERVAVCHLENGARHTLCFDVKGEEEAREACIKALISMTGLPEEKLVRVTKVEFIPVSAFQKE